MKDRILDSGWMSLLLFVGLTLVIVSCSGPGIKEESESNNDSLSGELSYQMRDTLAEFNPNDGSSGYVRIELKYPRFFGNDHASDFNRFVDSKLWAQNRTTQRSWVAQIQFFIDQYKQLKVDIGNYGNAWTHMETVSIRRMDKKIMTLEREYTEYSGGAHGRHEIHYYNFNLVTGDTLFLDDLIIPGGQEAVNALINFYFREQKGLTEEQSLIEEGGLSVESVTLTENFALDKKGIRFYYNPYEIAAYSAGPVIVEVPMLDLEPYLR